MKYIKYFIIILVVVLLIVSTSIILIKENNEQYYDETIPQDTLVELKASINKEASDYKFFGVDDFINQFLQYIKDKKENAIFELLDEDYRKQNQVADIIKNIDNIGNINGFYTQKLYKRESSKNTIYYISGKLEISYNKEESSSTEMYFELCVDNNNSTASIKLLSEEEYNKEITDTSNNIEEKIIAKNEYNNYDIPAFSSWELAERYLLDYTFKLKYEVEEAFDLLDTEYKKEKFHNDIKEFKEYIQENKDILYNLEIYDCETKITEEYIEYTIKDFSGNMYIIKRKSAMEYTIILDNNI